MKKDLCRRCKVNLADCVALDVEMDDSDVVSCPNYKHSAWALIRFWAWRLEGNVINFVSRIYRRFLAMYGKKKTVKRAGPVKYDGGMIEVCGKRMKVPALKALFVPGRDYRIHDRGDHLAVEILGKSTETGWMIERESGVEWWDFESMYWTKDPCKGTRFARKEDAEAMIGRYEMAAKATEHEWI